MNNEFENNAFGEETEDIIETDFVENSENMTEGENTAADETSEERRFPEFNVTHTVIM